MTTPRERIRQLGIKLGLKVVEVSIETAEEKEKRIMNKLGKQVEPRIGHRLIPTSITETSPSQRRPDVDFSLPAKGPAKNDQGEDDE